MNVLDMVLKAITDNYVVRNIVIIASIVVIVVALSFFFLDIYTRHGQKFVVPNLSGMTLEQAAEATSKFDSRLVIIDSLFIPSQKAGVVLEQNPKPGSFIKENRRLLLTVNTMNPKQIPLPYVAGYSLRQAKNRLLSAGLEISKITYQLDIATNNVIAQLYEGREIAEDDGVMINLGGSVGLIVGLSDTSAMAQVPDLTGLTIKEAKSRIWESGLNVGTIELSHDIDVTTMNQAVISAQSPFSLVMQPMGSLVALSATLDRDAVAAMNKKLTVRAKAVAKIEEQLKGYSDTLQILQQEEGKRKIESVHGVVTPEDSVFYINKIDALTIEKQNYIEDLNYTNKK